LNSWFPLHHRCIFVDWEADRYCSCIFEETVGSGTGAQHILTE